VSSNRGKLRKQYLTFLIAGGTATACQYIVLISLVEKFEVYEILASILGYLIGALVNYLINYYVTFSCEAHHLKTLSKFIIIACVGLGLNTLIMYLFHVVIGIYYLTSQILATLTVLIYNFIGHKYWTYKK